MDVARGPKGLVKIRYFQARLSSEQLLVPLAAQQTSDQRSFPFPIALTTCLQCAIIPESLRFEILLALRSLLIYGFCIHVWYQLVYIRCADSLPLWAQRAAKALEHFAH